MKLKITNICLLIVVLSLPTDSSGATNIIKSSTTNRNTTSNITSLLTNMNQSILGGLHSKNKTAKVTTFVVKNQLIANFVILSFALLINISVLLLSSTTWRISTHYKLTTCLALSDAVYCTVFLLNKARPFIDPVNPTMVYGRVACKLLGPMLVGTTFLDVGFIVLLAVERYVSICHPLRGGLQMRYVWSMIFGNVVFAMASISPYIYYYCEKNIPKNFTLHYVLYMLIGAGIIPTIVLSMLYFRSVMTLRSITGSLIYSSNNAAQIRRQKENTRILFIVVILIVVFFCLLIPNYLFYILVFLKVPMSAGARNGINIFTENVFHVHAIFNPIIYSLVDHRIRKIITCFVCGGKKLPRESSSLKMTTTSLL